MCDYCNCVQIWEDRVQAAHDEEFKNHGDEEPNGGRSGLTTGYVPRFLNEADTLHLIVLCVKYVDRNHHDWEEVVQLIQKFDESNVSKLLGT